MEIKSATIPVAVRCSECGKYWILDMHLDAETHTWRICSGHLQICRECGSRAEFAYCLPVLPRTKINLPNMENTNDTNIDN